MKKILIRITLCLFICVLCWGSALLSDMTSLKQELIRFHVIANSDSQEDQNIKYRIRDAVLDSIQADLENIQSKEAAVAYIREAIPKIEGIANSILRESGMDYEAVVTFCREAFPVRNYDTFSLPSGVYDTLKLTIGEGAGENWWCVAFPGLCRPTTAEAFRETAAAAGFSDSLTAALSRQDSFRLRFYLLDCIGKLENYFSGA